MGSSEPVEGPRTSRFNHIEKDLEFRVYKLVTDCEEMMTQIDEIVTRVEETRVQVDETRAQVNKTRARVDKTRAQVDELRSELKLQRLVEARRYLGNLLIDMIKQIVPKEANGAPFYHLEKINADLSDQALMEAKIPVKYWGYLRNLSEFADERDIVAYSTAEDFAILLSASNTTELLDFWGEAFPCAYGLTVAELVKESERSFAKLRSMVAEDQAC